jgi:hypothetical protein
MSLNMSLPPVPAPVVAKPVEGAGTAKPLGLAGQMQQPAPVVDPKAVPADPAAPVDPKAVAAAAKADEDKLADARKIAQRGRAHQQAWTKTQQEKAALERQIEQERAASGTLRERSARLDQLEAELRRDPLGAMKALGIKAEDAYRRAVQEGKPEAVVEALRGELQTVRTELKAVRDERQQERQAQTQQAGERDFVERVADDKTYPSLASTPPAVLLSAGKQLWQELYRRTGQSYTNEEILTFLDQQYAAHQKKAGGKAEKDPPQASGASEKSGPATSRTLSSDLASQSWSKPANWKELSDLEQRRLVAEQVKGRLITKRA